MRGLHRWKLGLGLALALLIPTQALAAAPFDQTVGVTIGNGVVSLAVDDNAAILGLGLGTAYLPTQPGAAWAVMPNPLAPSTSLTPNVETFYSTGVGALSSALVQDASGTSLR